MVPLGSATIISTGKLYFSRCKRAFSLNTGFCSSAWSKEEQNCSYSSSILHLKLLHLKRMQDKTFFQTTCYWLQFLGCRVTAHLHVLQLFDQRPAADEALVEQSQDGRTFQDCFPESSPRTYRGVEKRERERDFEKCHKNTQKCTVQHDLFQGLNGFAFKVGLCDFCWTAATVATGDSKGIMPNAKQ